MPDTLRSRLASIDPSLLRGFMRGLEKESLRATPEGRLSMLPHPKPLGSALTHPRITTDFSESQLELITGVHPGIESCLNELTQTHQFVHQNIGDERMWCSSMPCLLPPDDDIPLGQYGSSFIGRAKTLYRTGLKYRYGSRMQTISGLHYNFSVPDELWQVVKTSPGLRLDADRPQRARNQGYFGLIRNFRRESWLLMLLFGASPVVPRPFAEDAPQPLQPFGSDALGLPAATSLRMGPLGYQSDAQSSISVSYNCLNSYANSLHDALTDPYPPYEAIGIQVDGQYRQLSTALLQIENEFYGTIRPKQTIRHQERPLSALASRGVQYVEVRLMDLDPFSPIGITADTIRFLDIFLLYCLLSDSPRDTPEINARQASNRHEVAQRGREPGLMLTQDDGSALGLQDWGRRILAACQPVAERLDEAHPEAGGAYAAALAMAAGRLDDLDTTPSARLMAAVAEHPQASLIDWVAQQSARHRQILLDQPLNPDIRDEFVAMAQESFISQQKIEAADTGDFEQWRQQYITSVPPLISD
ncbi:MAG: glutamate--cysteine ligase [Lautropia sp.]|nr:glutamate--cysteine ligase [Lautropia sp.]